MKTTLGKINSWKYATLLSTSAITGCFVFAWLLTQKSEVTNSLWKGYSLIDLLLLIGTCLLIALTIISVFCFCIPRWQNRFIPKLSRLSEKWWFTPCVLGIYLIVLILFLLTVVLQTEIFGLKQFTVFIGWIFITFSCLLWLSYDIVREHIHRNLDSHRIASAGIIWLPGFLISASGYVISLLLPRMSRFSYLFICLFTLILLWLGKALWSQKNSSVIKPEIVHEWIVGLSVFLITYIVYRTTSILVGNIYTPAKSYFDELADAWIHGRLYLANPSQTHDLTLFNGNWYVANPPLVALFMLPWVALLGLGNFNTVVWSCLNGAVNGLLLYFLLGLANQKKWINIETKTRLLLVTFFLFGTAHYYLAVVGKMWFMSQIITVTLVLLSAIMAIKEKRFWVSASILALAAAARPNIIVIAPLLIGIRAQMMADEGVKVTFRHLFQWLIIFAFPVAVVGGVLLGYNWLRFGNLLDYGYLTENVADFMADDLRVYGTFHPHFILRNLRVMFLNIPQFSQSCGGLVPSVEGLSIFIASPALILFFWVFPAFKRQSRTWFWLLGLFVSILTCLVPLSFYYNTGSWQFGYKYLLDFIVPVVLLMAVNIRVPRLTLVISLVVLSVAINIYGVMWWFGLVCR
jgi:hypothetical protein